MKKVIKFIAFALCLILAITFGSINVGAETKQIKMSDGARIRTDEKIALQFEAKVSGVQEGDQVGFMAKKGRYTKEQMLEMNSTTISYVENYNGTILYSFKDITKDEYLDDYTVLAAMKCGDEYFYTDVVTRSVMEVAKKLGKGYNSYVDEILASNTTEDKYKEATVTLLPNGGVFSLDSSTDTKVVTMSEPNYFPTITKAGYKLLGWRNMNENKMYESFPGNEKDGAKIKYLAVWEELPNAAKLIGECISDDPIDILTVPTNYDGIEMKWSVDNSNVVTYSNGIFSVNDVNRTHKMEDVRLVLEYNGTKAQKTVKVAPVQLHDLSNISPFAVYFAVGSLGNYTSYGTHSIDNLFSAKVAQELDIVYYSFAYPTADGGVSLSKSGNYTKIHNQLMELRKNGTRIVLSIAGTSGTHCGYFNNICGDDTLRAKYVKNLIDLMEAENFDGLDIDWESADSNNLVVAEKMNALCKDLREEMDKRSGTNGTKYLLTAAIPSTSYGAAPDRFDLKTLNKYLDYVNMMSYDLNHEEKASHVSALYTSSHDRGYGFSADYGTTLFTGFGLSKKKIIIGTAAYGKAYQVTGSSPYSEYPGLGAPSKLTKVSGVSGSYDSGTMYYNGVLQLLSNSKYTKYTEYNGKNQHVGTYLYNATDKIMVAYEGEETIQLKAKYAKDNGLGIMMWSYCEDGSGTLVEIIANNIH